jgi:lipoprotein signal peptidase
MLMLKTRRRWMFATSVVVAVVMIDQLAKSWAANVKAGPDSAFVHNPGLLLGVAAVPVPVLILGMFAILGAFMAIVGRGSVQLGISPAIPALIVGGFAAHVLDPARFGAVRDFIHTPWIVIDVADIAVVIGIVLLVAAVALRVRAIHASKRHIVLDFRSLRPLIVDENGLAHDLAA